ncbi:MAG TPA: hypothetical protein DCS93_40310 [Microscillaceae bacterium]|nr:hypothetical protein [Microscillaceae bacterium]
MKAFNFSPNIHLASLFLRMFIGGMFFLHGIGKPLVAGMDSVLTGFKAQGFPAWTAYASTFVEIVAGLLLLTGSGVRVAALVLMPITLGILVYHFPNGWVFHRPGGGWEYPEMILVNLIAIFCLGAGKYHLRFPSLSKN